ncbi:hypothetical protein V8F20_007849 [Naviculisporaceae sp. PSN 640]
MAVIDGIPGLEGSIEIDGVIAREFDPPDDESCPATREEDYFMLSTSHNRASAETRRRHGVNYRPHVIKYIEAKPGAGFNFHLKRSPNFERAEGASGLYWMIEVDGIKGRSCTSDLDPLSRTYQDRFSEILTKDEGGNESWKRLRFGDLEIDDEGKYNAAELKKHIENARNLGVLKLYCYHSKGVRQKSKPDYPSAGQKTDSSQVPKVPEKALKGRSLDYTAKLEPSTNQAPLTRYAETLDPKYRPFAIFEFRYRSMEGLMKEGIVPRPRSITPPLIKTSPARTGTSAKNEVIDITGGGLKRERDPFDKDELEIISHRPGRNHKSRRLHDGILEIDLTEDD